MAQFIEGDGVTHIFLNDEEFEELGNLLPYMPASNKIVDYLQERYDDWKDGKDGTDDRKE